MNSTANIDNIKEQINRKKDSKPYFSTKENVRGVVTDYDHFPYRRFYRGKPESNKPVVIEREAGWRKVDNIICDSYTNDMCVYRNY